MHLFVQDKLAIRQRHGVYSGPLSHTALLKRGEQTMLFCVRDVTDTVQRCHLGGRFYEEPLLQRIAPMIPEGGTFVDVGANVGNHAIYAALVAGAGRIVPFEPNPAAFEILLANIILNGLEDRTDLSALGFGLSDEAQDGLAMSWHTRNLGGGTIRGTGGDISVKRGDDHLAKEAVDFLKIDTEGMEMAALAGLEQTIARTRPNILIEVDKSNREAFDAWAEDHAYTMLFEEPVSRRNDNLVLQASERI
ncbi:MAG: FkbM family methyltransferase [Pseudomonadota bacterium]